MAFSIRQYFIVALITGLSLAQSSAPDNHCHSDLIQNDDLKSDPTCKCMIGTSGTCTTRSLGSCHSTALRSTSELEPGHGDEGCTENNYGCDSCYLWFNELCYCLKNDNCKTSPSGSWIRLGSGKITSKTRMPGILDLASEEPWDWGQTLPDFSSSKALAINSVLKRVQEQIHMHVCDVKDDARKVLGELWRADYEDEPKLVPGHEWKCRVEKTKNNPITGVTSDFWRLTENLADCDKLVGAAVLIDSHDYTWTCLTTGYASAQGEFCGK